MSEPRAKYGNRRATLDGLVFASRAEARRYSELRLLEQAGAINCLRVHPCYELMGPVVLDGRRRPPLRYRADFEYREPAGGVLVVEDVKSAASKTTAYRMRRHLLKAIHGIEVREVESSRWRRL